MLQRHEKSIILDGGKMVSTMAQEDYKHGVIKGNLLMFHPF
jgi:hypothetical protein